jgi:hypothetical protein
LIICNFSLASDTNSVTKAETSKTIKTSLTILFGFPFPSLSPAFSDVYKSKLNGKNDYLKPSGLLSFKILVKPFDKLEIGMSMDILEVKLRDYYADFFEVNGKLQSIEISEAMDYNQFPLFLTCQYSPQNISYSSYLGVGLGLNFADLNWTEEVNSAIANNSRQGGEILNDNFVSPAMKFYAGTMLDFDKASEWDFLGAFHFEASFVYSFSNLKLFDKFNSLFNNPVPEFNQTYSFVPFYLSLSAGISFNLYPEFSFKNKK